MNISRRRALVPVMESMEGRQLLSYYGGASNASALLNRIEVASATNPRPSAASGNPSTALIGSGNPTPHELARQTFRASFSGPFRVGPGRFSDQKQLIFMHGIGGSNFFLHGDYTLGLVTPTDPNAAITGSAVLNDKNFNSSGILGLVVTADPQSIDRFGRPTRLTFVSDPNVYSGIFFVENSVGTVRIRYRNNGVATAVFEGQVYTSGLNSPLINTGLYARGGRTSAR